MKMIYAGTPNKREPLIMPNLDSTPPSLGIIKIVGESTPCPICGKITYKFKHITDTNTIDDASVLEQCLNLQCPRLAHRLFTKETKRVLMMGIKIGSLIPDS